VSSLVSAASLDPFRRKSVTLATESAFTRVMFDAVDVARQGQILTRVAKLIDEGTLQPPWLCYRLSWSLESLQEAHTIRQ